MIPRQIVKVQVPLATSDPEPKALIYNEDRSLHQFVPVDEELLAMMDGAPKKFFWLQSVNDREVCFSEAPWQDW